MSYIGKCEHCGEGFSYELWHTGFSELSYAYCDSCEMVVTLDGWKFPKQSKCRVHEVIPKIAEGELESCKCGGRFKHGTNPRCPHCKKELSAKKATKWIERNAPGTKSGWKWQRNWTGIYVICIEGKRIKDNWKKIEV